MKVKKLIFVAAMVVLAAAVALWAHRRKNKPKPQEQVLREEVFVHDQAARMHEDSANYHRVRADAAYRRYVESDSLQWDSLRATYEANLRRKIRAELAGQRN